MKNSKAAVAWTGGKDSAMALHIAKQQGLDIVLLVTFVPTPYHPFKAHPLSLIKQQAHSLGIPHLSLKIRKTHCFEDYINAINTLHEQYNISNLVTGDIDFIQNQPNWIKSCCDRTSVTPSFPLWQQSRETLLKKMLMLGLVFKFSYFNHAALPREWLGKILNTQRLNALRTICDKKQIDLCGENGEYHTMVIDAPFFTYPIEVLDTSITA